MVLAAAFVISRNDNTVIPVRLVDPELRLAWIWSFDELEDWDGQELPFVLERLGLPDVLDEYGPPVPTAGVWHGVSDRLDQVAPGYANWVRSMEWHRGGINHQVFLFIDHQRWVVLDAVAWAEGVEF